MIKIRRAVLLHAFGGAGHSLFVDIAQAEVGDRVAVGHGIFGAVAVGLSLGRAVFVLGDGWLHDDDIAVLVLQEHTVDQLLKVAVVELLFDGREGLFVFEIQPRLEIVQPCVGYLDVVVEPLG